MPEHGHKVGHNRWCETCNHEHAHLYPCEHYPPEVLDEIREEHDQLQTNIRDPVWIQTQIDNGVPPFAMAAFKALVQE